MQKRKGCDSVNKKYRFLSFILIIVYGFFFTTKLWNIDDRPRFNSWVVNSMGNSEGRIVISQVVYVSPIDALDIILEHTSFGTSSEFSLEAVVHRLDGTSGVVPLTLMDEATNMNITRKFLRVYLDDNLHWHYVEIALIDEITGDRSRLTMDWRMVERVDEVTGVASYDLSFSDFDDFDDFDDVAITILDDVDDLQDYSHTHHEDFIQSHAPDLSLEGLVRSLDIAITEYAIVNELLELDPYDDILSQSVAFYESEIQRLEAKIQEYHDESK